MAKSREVGGGAARGVGGSIPVRKSGGITGQGGSNVKPVYRETDYMRWFERMNRKIKKQTRD
jgi:hypothetical protein